MNRLFTTLKTKKEIPGEVLPDAGNQPDPTAEKIRRYRKNAEKWVGEVVKNHLTTHEDVVLHGSRSLKMLLPHYKRKVHDWDLFSPKERQTALEIERKIDQKAGCDIARTRYQHIKSKNLKPEIYKGEHLYIVETPRVKGDAEVDVMDKPKNLPTVRHNGITHEDLLIAHQKALTRQYRQPQKKDKARYDTKAIEQKYHKNTTKKPHVIGLMEKKRII